MITLQGKDYKTPTNTRFAFANSTSFPGLSARETEEIESLERVVANYNEFRHYL